MKKTPRGENVKFGQNIYPIRNADQIRSILKDIYDTRQAKLRKSVDMFFQEEYLTAKINHLQQIELSSFRNWNYKQNIKVKL